jgi:hypothetical protein
MITTKTRKIMKTYNDETFAAILNALENTSIYHIFSDAIGTPEETDSDDSYALMFNMDNNTLFFLSYATNENKWADTAEQQNPWFCIGYVNANECIDGDPAGRIEGDLKYAKEEFEAMERAEKEHKLAN